MKNDIWKRSGVGLYSYQPTGAYFARVRFGGKLYRRALGRTDYQLARRKLAAFRHDLERTDARAGNTTFGAVLDRYEATLGRLAPGTQQNKRAVLEKLRRTYLGVQMLPLRQIRPSDISAWLSRHCGSKSAAYYNDSLSTIRQALDLAVADRIIAESPASKLKYQKREQPIRQTPTFEQFQSIVADIRGQTFHRDRQQSGDFIEFMGLSGLGQAEMAGLTRADVDLVAGRITIFRHKTAKGFVIPIYPQLRPLLERLCVGKGHDARLFIICEARKALNNACKRLGLPRFTPRSLRRMFITRAIERGVDVKVIAEWQGHKDGGKLILGTYSHVNRVHSQRMAQLMATEEQNVTVFRGAEAA